MIACLTFHIEQRHMFARSRKTCCDRRARNSSANNRNIKSLHYTSRKHYFAQSHHALHACASVNSLAYIGATSLSGVHTRQPMESGASNENERFKSDQCRSSDCLCCHVGSRCTGQLRTWLHGDERLCQRRVHSNGRAKGWPCESDVQRRSRTERI